MADWIHGLNRRLNMYLCRLPDFRNSGQYTCTGAPRQPRFLRIILRCTTMDAYHRKEKHMLLHRFRQFAAVLGLILVSSLGIAAQSQNPSSQPPAQDQQSQAPAEDDNLQTFKAQVNVVNLFFNVKGKHGMLIPNVTTNDLDRKSVV